MTPERAEEIASRIRANYALGTIARDAIKQAILQACAEQREADAKICDLFADQHGYHGKAAQDAAAAIRGQT
jgi:hypothetical protein